MLKQIKAAFHVHREQQQSVDDISNLMKDRKTSSVVNQ